MPDLSSTVSFDELRIDRRKINGDLRGARNSTMLALVGNPRGTYDDECRSPTNERIARMMVTDNVGPFKATGLGPAVEALKAILADVKSEFPDIHAALSSAGMLCCRNVRGSQTAISNHSWGTAIDLKINGQLDRRGDERTQRGLLSIHPIFNRHRFYWGAAFTTEDCMHFEASDQLVREWAAKGRLGSGIPTTVDTVLDLGDRGPEVEELQEKLNLLLGLDLDRDGIFGRGTRAAVMEFQRQQKLGIDGVVGEKTIAKIESAVKASAREAVPA